MPPMPGYHSRGRPRYVEASCGGDPSILAFYSTVASTAWTPKRLPPPPDNNTEISTGYVKNKTHVQPHHWFGEGIGDDTYRTEYMAQNDRTMQKQRKSGDLRIATSDSRLTGGFAAIGSNSPIKWNAPPGSGPTTKRMLSVRRRRDPTSWENNGMGPSEWSTSMKQAYLHPAQLPGQVAAGLTAKSADRGSTATGWRENNNSREHPWEHPGAVPWQSDHEKADELVMQATSGYNERATEELPVTDSSYTRNCKKLLLGSDHLDPHERMSTTHLAYVQGRTSRMEGRLVEIAPRMDGQPLGKSGFLKHVSTKDIFPSGSGAMYVEGEGDDPYRTISSLSYEHPGLRHMPRGDSVVPSMGLQSAYARAITPVDTLSLGNDERGRPLHPTVKAIMAKRDPYYFNTKVYKVTDPVD